jgi:hypothetical protein
MSTQSITLTDVRQQGRIVLVPGCAAILLTATWTVVSLVSG